MNTISIRGTGRNSEIRQFCVVMLAAVLIVALSTAAQDTSADGADAELLRQSGAAAQQFIQRLGSVRYSEHLAQRELKENGKINYQQDAFFDSLTLVRKDSGRLVTEEAAVKERPSMGFETRPLLNTTGFSTLALIMHPYYEQSFQFSRLEDEVVSGRRLHLLRFVHVKGTDTPMALQLRGRNYPLDLSGMVWLDAETGSVARVVALLSEPLEDIGLHSLNCDVQYSPIALPGTADTYWLPESASIELRTLKRHWRNIHSYANYRKYSVDVVLETGETP
jgi:hypothetical protein